MNDTAKEGDLNRGILNCQYSLPFFFSHSALSKYLVENIDYILKCDRMPSPLQRIRVLEGSLTNTKSGIGKNVESDLVQEHVFAAKKHIIKSIGANKTEQSISRVTRSARMLSMKLNMFKFWLKHSAEPQKWKTFQNSPRGRWNTVIQKASKAQAIPIYTW